MRAAGVIVVNEEKRHVAEIRWARERSFRRGKVWQKEENRSKACIKCQAAKIRLAREWSFWREKWGRKGKTEASLLGWNTGKCRKCRWESGSALCLDVLKLTRKERVFPVQEKKRRVVSGRSQPLIVGNLKMRSLTLRSSKEKLCLQRCRTSESIKWHWKWSHGLRLCCSEKLLRGRFYLNVERWKQCSKVSSVGNRAKKDDNLSTQLDEHSPASRLVESE